MKKSILFVATVLFIGSSLVSCKKDYSCKCSKTYTSGSGSSTRDFSIFTYRENRKRAEDRCNENAATGTDLGGNYTVNCQIQ